MNNSNQQNLMDELKKNIEQEKKIASELNFIYRNQISAKSNEEKNMFEKQINSLKKSLSETNSKATQNLRGTFLTKPLPKIQQQTAQPVQQQTINSVQQPVPQMPVQSPPKNAGARKILKKLKPEQLEEETLKRLRKKEKTKSKEKKKKPNKYAKIANTLFSEKALKLLHRKKGMFENLERDLIKANLQFTPTTYVSIILYTTFLSIFAGILITLFFLFFKVTAELPIISFVNANLGTRFLHVFWILIVTPVVTFIAMYVYPALERKSTEYHINHELPFATINMAAIAGSLIDPSKIFNIIITTKEYPFLSKEFTKIMNEINIHGYNFVSALKSTAFNSPSKKLSALLSGLATTINSGGDLPNFFEERSKSLLFEYRIEKEKQTKSAESFMDIYISLVVAAPMILMLVLVMMKISGLGVSFSTGTITLIMVLGVSVLNIIFLVVLGLRKE